MFCDSQLQVWYFYRIEGGGSFIWKCCVTLSSKYDILLDGGGWSFRLNVVWLSAPGMIFILERGGNHSVGNVVWLSPPGMIFILDRGGRNFVWFSAQFLLFHLPKVKKYFSTFSFPLTESGKELVHFPHFTYRKWKRSFSLSPFHLQKVEKWSNFFSFSFQLSPSRIIPARTGVIDK